MLPTIAPVRPSQVRLVPGELTVGIYVYVPESWRQTMQQEADAQQVSVSAWIRARIAAQIASRPSA